MLWPNRYKERQFWVLWSEEEKFAIPHASTDSMTEPQFEFGRHEWQTVFMHAIGIRSARILSDKENRYLTQWQRNQKRLRGWMRIEKFKLGSSLCYLIFFHLFPREHYSFLAFLEQKSISQLLFLLVEVVVDQLPPSKREKREIIRRSKTQLLRDGNPYRSVFTFSVGGESTWVHMTICSHILSQHGTLPLMRPLA